MISDPPDALSQVLPEDDYAGEFGLRITRDGRTDDIDPDRFGVAKTSFYCM